MDRDNLDFATFCIDILADRLSISQSQSYRLLKDSGLLSNYIVACYDVLHTFGRTYLADDLEALLHERGMLA